jgi:putative salt-induced outer membrane protein
VGLSSSISTAFSLATTFSLRYDNNPLPGIRKTDTTTALSLVYQLL